MIKFNRRYRLTISPASTALCTNLSESVTEKNQNPVVIEYPITAMFIVNRTISSSLNSMDIQLVNLNEDTRSFIFQDRFGFFSAANGDVTKRRVKLEAGYGDNLYTIFQGNLYEAGSVRKGSDIITHINARDGGFSTNLTQIFETINTAGLPFTQKALIEYLAGKFPDLQIGAIGDDRVIFNRPVSLNGNVWEILKVYSNNKISIDLEKVNYLLDFQVVEDDVLTIDPNNGLLETPNRNDNGLSLGILFEPRVSMGRKIELKSSVLPQYDGAYRINAIKHQCIISGAVGGECRTTLNIFREGAPIGQKFESVKESPTRNVT